MRGAREVRAGIDQAGRHGLDTGDGRGVQRRSERADADALEPVVGGDLDVGRRELSAREAGGDDRRERPERGGQQQDEQRQVCGRRVAPDRPEAEDRHHVAASRGEPAEGADRQRIETHGEDAGGKADQDRHGRQERVEPRDLVTVADHQPALLEQERRRDGHEHDRQLQDEAPRRDAEHRRIVALEVAEGAPGGRPARGQEDRDREAADGDGEERRERARARRRSPPGRRAARGAPRRPRPGSPPTAGPRARAPRMRPGHGRAPGSPSGVGPAGSRPSRWRRRPARTGRSRRRTAPTRIAPARRRTGRGSSRGR